MTARSQRRGWLTPPDATSSPRSSISSDADSGLTRAGATTHAEARAGLPPVSAADVVSAQITDRGIAVANRTNYPVRLEIELTMRDEGTPNVAGTLERLRLTLKPREQGLIPQSKLGEGASLSLPQPVMRQWSHDRGVVYEGGQLQLALVRAVFLAAPTNPNGSDSGEGPDHPDGSEKSTFRELGQAERAGGLGLGVLITAKEIREAIRPIWRE